MFYTPSNWYWIVGSSTTQVWSSARAQYVPLTDTAYEAWLAAGGFATKIDSEASLQDVLATQFPAGWPPTLAQQAMTAIASGLAITSTSTPALNGTYACDAATQSHLMAELIAVQISGGTKFADGGSTVLWPDTAGTGHSFTPSAFQGFALAIGAYVANLYKVINGTVTTLPAASATIA